MVNFQAVDPGSIPGRRKFLLLLIFLGYEGKYNQSNIDYLKGLLQFLMLLLC